MNDPPGRIVLFFLGFGTHLKNAFTDVAINANFQSVPVILFCTGTNGLSYQLYNGTLHFRYAFFIRWQTMTPGKGKMPFSA